MPVKKTQAVFECIRYILPVPELSGIFEPELKQKSESGEGICQHLESFFLSVCGGEAVGGEIGTVL